MTPEAAEVAPPSPEVPETWKCHCRFGPYEACGAPSEAAPLVLRPGCFAYFYAPSPAAGPPLGLEVLAKGSVGGLSGELSLWSGEPGRGPLETRTARGQGPEQADWTRISLDDPLSVDPYERMLLTIRNVGRGEVEVGGIDFPRSPVVGSIVRATHRWTVRFSEEAEPARLWMPLPLTAEGQVPLDIALVVEPPEAVAERTVRREEGGNLGVSLTFRPGMEDVPVLVGWDAVVLLSRLPPEGPSEADGSAWTGATASVQAEVPLIAEPAARIAGSVAEAEERLAALLEWKAGLFARRRGLVVPWVVDAESVARRRRGTCTSNANLMAALGRAAGLPTRVLSGIPVGPPLLTHYIDETWLGASEGWRRYEPQSTSTRYRMDDFVVLRVVGVEDEGTGAMASGRLSARGVPLWSRDEVESGTLWADNGDPGVGGCRRCDSMAERVGVLQGSVSEGQALFARAAESWEADLGRRLEGTLSAERTVARAAAMEVRSGADVEAFLQALEGLREPPRETPLE